MSTEPPDTPSPDAPGEDPRALPDTGSDASTDTNAAAGPDSASAAKHHDALFKSLFSDPVQAAARLQAILPPCVARHIDWDSLQPVHASFVSDLLEQRHGNLLFSASLIGRLGLFISIRYTERVNPHVDRDTLIRHLAPLVDPGLEDTMLTFEQLLRKEEFQKGVEQGLKTGIDKGVVKGRRELLLDQLIERFGSLPAAVTQRLAEASLQDLKRWGSRILTAASLDDVFASS